MLHDVPRLRGNDRKMEPTTLYDAIESDFNVYTQRSTPAPKRDHGAFTHR